MKNIRLLRIRKYEMAFKKFKILLIIIKCVFFHIFNYAILFINPLLSVLYKEKSFGFIFDSDDCSYNVSMDEYESK